MSEMKDWPLVPVDPACVPEGWEAAYVGVPDRLESTVIYKGDLPTPWDGSWMGSKGIRLIIRPIPKPIKLPVTIVPPGWWVAKDESGVLFICDHKPNKSCKVWHCYDCKFILATPIAAQLPEAYLALPWDQSLMQQTEGM